MTDSLSPGNRDPLPDDENVDESPPEEKAGIRHENLGDAEAGLRPPESSFARDAGPLTPERVHQEHIRTEGTASDTDSGNVMPQMTDDELSRLPILDSGVTLKAGEHYYNLDDQRGPFRPERDLTVGTNERIVARMSMDDESWSRLTGRARAPEIGNPD